MGATGEGQMLAGSAMPASKYASIDELIGRIEGIERTILIDKDNDTLLNIIEKIALIPDNKLVQVEPIAIPCSEESVTSNNANGREARVVYTTRPKVKGILSLPDVFAKLLSNQTPVY